MRVNLKGVHRVTRILAMGQRKEYYYAWRGGPRLVGERGSPEFLASYQAAYSARKTPPRSQFKSILIAYIASRAFSERSPKTQCEQGKTGVRVCIPVTKRLKAMLDNAPRVSTVILTNSRGRPWLERSFREAWHAAYIKAEIEDDLHFHDLRGTAITRLAEAGCTTPEIAVISGHGMKTVEVILDKYMARTSKMAVAAIAKLERGRA